MPSAYANCPSQNAFKGTHCYGIVTTTCQNGVFTYSVRMSPGYLFTDLAIYYNGMQVSGNGNIHSPDEWSGGLCGNSKVSWSVPTSHAMANCSGFQITMNQCFGSQFVGLHVVPVLAQNPYIPPGVGGPSFTFFAAAGCQTQAATLSWGRLKGIYR